MAKITDTNGNASINPNGISNGVVGLPNTGDDTTGHRRPPGLPSTRSTKMTTMNTAAPSRDRQAGLLDACLAVRADLWRAMQAWQARSAEAQAIAMLDDHIRQDLGLPLRQTQVRSALRFI